MRWWRTVKFTDNNKHRYLEELKNKKKKDNREEYAMER